MSAERWLWSGPLSAEDWQRVDQVYELVRQEGDARAERVIGDLMRSVVEYRERSLAWRALAEHLDRHTTIKLAHETSERLRLDRDGWKRRALDAEEALRGRARS